MSWLSSPEMNLIRRDAKEMIADSQESVNITISYSVFVNPVQDPVYKTWSGDSFTTKTIVTPSIQQIVKARNREILRWGILDEGDCIFFIDPSVDLSGIQYDSGIVLAGTSPLPWYPVNRRFQEFWEYLIFRVGDNQIMQPIPCTIKQ